jgi:hypothetical protein
MRGLSWSRGLAVALAAATAAGCLEADSSVELNDKGAGQVSMDGRFSVRFQAYARRLARLDPSLDPMAVAAPLFLKTPDAATAKELEKAGLKVLEQATSRTDTDLATRFRVQFSKLAALDALGRIRGGEATGPVPPGGGGDFPGDSLRLTRDADGVYALEHVVPVRGSFALGTDKVSGSVERLGKLLAVAQPLANELSAYRIRIALQVPGEIVDFSPGNLGKADPARDPATRKPLPPRVVFTLDRAGLDSTGLGQPNLKGEFLYPSFRVRFRLPKGKSLPEAALWPGKSAAGGPR